MALRDRIAIISALVLLSSLAWAVTIHHSGGQASGIATGGSMTMGMPFSLSSAALYLGLWGIMMVAMMFPSVAPMVVLFSSVHRNREPQNNVFGAAWVFAAGYVVLWTLCGVVAYGADLGVQALPERFPVLRENGHVIAGATLFGAGLYQLTPYKYRCLSHCRSPLGFLLDRWRDGRWGALRMGLEHGAFCLGCCWSLMTVLFVVGTMNLVWMGALTLLIFVEKVVPSGVGIGKAAGVGLMALGLLLAWGPHPGAAP